ncbi:MerR family transcriptional regulator [Flavobacteriaceae bacterium]|nr:MerR family transcriptional regulator [Flavobacteriaceae bacterium]
MNTIKTSFSIKDLENLSGIKAHTIRIWEKRYNLLEPERTNTNIRTYNLRSLQKLMNISFLNSNGYKISKIAALDEFQIASKVKEISFQGHTESHAFNAFKLAMLNFDQALFYNTYNRLLEEKSFREIFYELFIPIIQDIGLLWQTLTITPSHEHFLFTHIRQKVLIHIERLQSANPKPDTKTFVLFLPLNEVHDIGLLFINYELLSRGYHTIYLGENVPVENLNLLNTLYDDITYISYFTIKPYPEDVENYLTKLYSEVIENTTNSVRLIGPRFKDSKPKKTPKQMKIYDSIKKLVKDL